MAALMSSAGVEDKLRFTGNVHPQVAGIAMAHGLAIVTRNTAHFQRVKGLIVLNWAI